MRKRYDIDKILMALDELREANKEAREADERYAKEAREADVRHAKEAREADERLREQIAALTGTVGNYVGEALETIASSYVMRHLELTEGLQFEDMLYARYAPVNGSQREFDLYGMARRGGKEVLVVGEVKRSITCGDVMGFAIDTAALTKRRRKEVVRAIFCIHIDRAAARLARRHDIRVVVHRRYSASER
jgi:FtsZ-binding cell division protein ZapB